MLIIVDRDSFRYIEERTLAEALSKEIDFDIPLYFEANHRQDTLADSHSYNGSFEECTAFVA